MARDIRITPKLNSVTANDFPEIVFGGASASTIKLKVDDDGSVVYTGTYGVLFNVTDSKDGLLHSVNDVSGLPILQVYSYDYVQMGKWDKNTLVANSDKVGIGLTAPSALLHIQSDGTFSQVLIMGSSSQTTPMTIWANESGTVSTIYYDGVGAETQLQFYNNGLIKTEDKSNIPSGSLLIKTGDSSGIGTIGDITIQGGYDGSNYGNIYVANTGGGNVTMLAGSGGILSLVGNTEITTGYGIKMGGSYYTYTAVTLSRDVIEIGDWDMSNSATLAVGHNFAADFINIRSISGFIQDDSSTNMYPITFGKLDNSTDKFGVSVYQIDSTNFYLIHDNASGNFNNSNFSTTPFNRGWITVEYIAPL